MDRRVFNKILGASFLGGSVLGTTKENSQRARLKKNVVLISTDYGFNNKNFFPKDDSLDSKYLSMYGSIRNKMSVFHGIEQSEMGGGHRSHHSIFTAQSRYGKMVKPFVSLDQFITSRVVQETRHKFLNLSTGKSSMTSWSLSGQAVPFLTGVEDAYAKIFKDRINTQQLKDEKEYLKNFSKKVLAGSKQALYKNSLEELQEEVEERIKWSATQLPKVDYEFKADKNEFMNLDVNLELIKLALLKKQCRIFNFNISHGGTVDLEGISEGYHALTHSGKDPEKVEKLIRIEEYKISKLAKFLNELDELKLLDETLVIITGAFGHSNTHSTKDLPCILVGGGIDHAGLVQCKDKNGLQIHNLTELYVSFMQMAGLESVNTFAGYTGNLNKYFG
ncbi:MAG: DUF1552 domain-containing protein [Lentisphaeraceae bacterium]|nr:DUF1552 domain-containing protein [Lentisphaeraceae bacterium]